jgi:hypothetical protein
MGIIYDSGSASPAKARGLCGDEMKVKLVKENSYGFLGIDRRGRTAFERSKIKVRSARSDG